MKNAFSRLPLPAIGLFALVLTGCASTTGASQASHSASPGAAHSTMDMQRMCDMHRQMMSRPAAERQAMMQEHMKSMSMSADAMHKHMQEMQARCK